MNTHDFEDRGSLRKVPGGNKNQAERDRLAFEVVVQFLHPLLQTRLTEVAGPMARDRLMIGHAATLKGQRLNATRRTEKQGSPARQFVQERCTEEASTVATASTGASTSLASA